MGINRRGFTLVEILLTSVILTLGTLLLHESYLHLADLYGRYVNGMRLERWVNDQLWEARESIVYSPAAGDASGSGTVEIASKSFDWHRSTRALQARGLYSIRMEVSWLEGNRPAGLAREVYAFHRDIQ